MVAYIIKHELKNLSKQTYTVLRYADNYFTYISDYIITHIYAFYVVNICIM